MTGSRIAKTFDKLRAGRLPVPTAATKSIVAGLGTACSGCGEVIERFESSYQVRSQGSTLLRFHVVCHETWVRFKRSP
jgi:hypothetical protein